MNVQKLMHAKLFKQLDLIYAGNVRRYTEDRFNVNCKMMIITSARYCMQSIDSKIAFTCEKLKTNKETKSKQSVNSSVFLINLSR